jgi:hypothetical protein
MGWKGDEKSRFKRVFEEIQREADAIWTPLLNPKLRTSWY